MLMVNMLQRAKIPVLADDIFDYLEKRSVSNGFPYPEERKSRMRQLQRDMIDIADMFHVEIKRVGKSSYRIAESYDDPPIDYNRFFADFDLLTSLDPGNPISKHVIPERNRNKGSENLSPILQAIKRRNVIEFDYTNYRKGNIVRHHKICPHYLKEDQRLWYVIGFENGKPFSFALDRITALSVLDEEFKFNTDFDLEEHFKDCFGIWSDPSVETEEIELKYDSLDGSFLKVIPIHPSQEIIADREDEFRIKLRLKITRDFVMELLRRSRSLEVIRPLHLRQKIYDLLAAGAIRNG